MIWTMLILFPRTSNLHLKKLCETEVCFLPPEQSVELKWLMLNRHKR